MTRDEIIKMAREAGGSEVDWVNPQCFIGLTAFEVWELERFFHAAYAAGAAAEREACAKVCEDTDIVDFEYCMVLHEDAAKTLANAAAAIRARSAK